jgi:glutathione S-transferase
VRARWLLEELGLPHQLVTLAPEELGGPELAALLPLAQVPVLDDGGVRLHESGAIVHYLLDAYGHGRLEPRRESAERPAFLQWFHFAETALGAPLSTLARDAQRPDDAAAGARRDAERALAMLGRRVEGRSWLAGEFSAADVMMGWSATIADRLGLVGDALPSVRRYVGRCHERSTFRRSMYA